MGAATWAAEWPPGMHHAWARAAARVLAALALLLLATHRRWARSGQQLDAAPGGSFEPMAARNMTAALRAGVPPLPDMEAAAVPDCRDMLADATAAGPCQLQPSAFANITIMRCAPEGSPTGYVLLFHTVNDAPCAAPASTASSAASSTTSAATRAEAAKAHAGEAAAAHAEEEAAAAQQAAAAARVARAAARGSAPAVVASGKPHPVYRIRLVGKREIVRLPMHYCGSAAVARYDVSVAGTYHAEVLKLYDAFTHAAPPPVNDRLRASSFTIRVTSRPPQDPVTGARACMLNMRGQAEGTCSPCATHSQPGRWVVAKPKSAETQALLSALQTTCVPDTPRAFADPPQCPTPLLHAAAAGADTRHELEWLPYGCRYAPLTAARRRSCLRSLRREVWVAGDSQARHLHAQLVHVLVDESPSMQGFGELTQPKTAAQRVVSEGAVFSYHRTMWGLELLNLTSTPHVGLLIINFGSSALLTQLWSVSDFAALVARVAAHLAQLQQQHGTRVHWTTMNPFPLLKSYHVVRDPRKPGVDHRTEPLLLLYNAVASSIMRQHGVAVVDLWSIAAPLAELSYNMADYLGYVGMAQAGMLAQVVCGSL